MLSLDCHRSVVLPVRTLALVAGTLVVASAHAEVSGWGANNYGQVSAPASAATVARLAGGWEHSVGLRSDGTVVAWGRNVHGESVPPASIGTALQVAAGWDHSVALRTDGTVICFGAGGSGQSGFPHYGQSIVPSTVGTATQIAAGGYHTLAIRTDGTVRAWGLNSYGQITVPASLGVVVQVAGGNRHSAARRANGTVLCWGDNQFGQCTPPAGLGAVAEVDGGSDFTAARMADGTVRCWGSNTSGECNVPAGLSSVVAIAAGGWHTLALRANGSVVTWGLGTSGQTTVPTSLGVATALGAGSSFSLAVHSNVIEVPGNYATIQAAIDAAPFAASRIVNVAAGIRNEFFSLNGKNIVVRGAAGGTTILDGTGLTTSIANLNGEPATAGLENLVFRNGTSGQPINPPSYIFTGGGGVFGRDSSAFIRNCTFQDCGADFGAGVYLLRGNINVDSCTFTSNDATIDGGGMQTYAASGTVRNSTFSQNRCALTYAGSGSAFKAVGIRAAGTSVVLENCGITDNPVPGAGAAVEYFENQEVLAGTLRLVNTDIVGNLTGAGTTNGSAGLRVLGSRSACVLSGGTTICANTPQNVEGPFLAEGKWLVCDCLADFTGDGLVNAADLGVLLSAWGAIDAQGSGDVNHDGIVDGADLSMLLSTWGACPN